MLYSPIITDIPDAITDGLRDVKHKTDAEWSVEDICQSVLSGKSFLFIDSSDSTSFVVLTEWQCPYTKEHILEVQAAYSKTGDAMAKYSSDIDAIGREAGCSRIEFSSPREGFKRLAGEYGYEPVFVTYRKKL